MAYENIPSPRSINATATFATKQYTFVTIDSNGTLATPSAGGSAIGVIQDKPTASQPGAVCRPGDVTKVQAGGSFNPGDYVMTNSSGQAVVATSGSYILGIALAAGANGYDTTIIFQPRGSKL